MLGQKYITRIDHRNTHGWYVRVLKDSQPYRQKLFSDGVYGGKRKALHAAKAYRDELCQRLFGDNVSRQKRLWGVGIRYDERVTDQGYVCRSYIAYWNENGVQRKRSFSVNKYGIRGAKRMALEERRRRVAGR